MQQETDRAERDVPLNEHAVLGAASEGDLVKLERLLVENPALASYTGLVRSSFASAHLIRPGSSGRTL